jgi:hypothetical protein
VFSRRGGTFTTISYDPQDPGNVILPRAALVRRGELFLGLVPAFGGLLMTRVSS